VASSGSPLSPRSPTASIELSGGISDGCSDDDLYDEFEGGDEEVASELISDSKAFQYVVGVVIMLNTIVIALEAAFIRESWARPVFSKLELLFTVVYVAEIFCKLRDKGSNLFFCGADRVWNIFDFIITATGVLDSISSALGAKGGSGASAGRLFRILRILRLFRTLRFLNEVDYVLATAAKATLKLSLLVFLVVFISAIVVTNMLWDADDEIVQHMFGDLGNSMWTMFTLMTLDNWITTIERVLEIKPGMLIFFVLFIFVASIALMSLVPAIFIELNMTSRKRDEEREKTKADNKLKKGWTKMLTGLFKKADDNDNGFICQEEMKAVLTQEKKLRNFQRGSGLMDEGDFMHVKLGLFELWEEQAQEYGDLHEDEFPGLNKEDFVNKTFRHRLDVPPTALWKCITMNRMQMSELTCCLMGRMDDVVDLVRSNARDIRELRECVVEQHEQVRKEFHDRISQAEAQEAAASTAAEELRRELSVAQEQAALSAKEKETVEVRAEQLDRELVAAKEAALVGALPRGTVAGAAAAALLGQDATAATAATATSDAGLAAADEATSIREGGTTIGFPVRQTPSPEVSPEKEMPVAHRTAVGIGGLLVGSWSRQGTPAVSSLTAGGLAQEADWRIVEPTGGLAQEEGVAHRRQSLSNDSLSSG